ncbi:MAG: hypothetical protein Q4B26_09670, partial [Eubacteriales bacterium]|nr:hypothetical protein [Eubacteriales bacterium]
CQETGMRIEEKSMPGNKVVGDQACGNKRRACQKTEKLRNRHAETREEHAREQRIPEPGMRI